MTDTKQLTLPITGMTCANCATTIERRLNPMIARAWATWEG